MDDLHLCAKTRGYVGCYRWWFPTSARLVRATRPADVSWLATRTFRSRSGPQGLAAGGRMAGGLVAYVRRTVSRAMHAAGSPLRLRTRTALPPPVTGT